MDRGWLGATLKDSTTPLGAQVTEVDRNSPAAHAGLRRGDIVSRLNDERVESARFMIRAVAAAAPGKTVALTILRHGQSLELQALVGHRPLTEDTDSH
jgi:S1-C subfamily serine protease